MNDVRLPEEELNRRIKRLRLLGLDVDGVLTDGKLYIGAEGEIMKVFCARDGQGIKDALASGVGIALISARDSDIARRRAEELGIDPTMVRLGCRDKLAEMEALCAAVGCALEEAAYMGDDVLDVPVMQKVGLALTPADACVAAHAHWRSVRLGGAGAVREFCDMMAKIR